MSGSLGELLDAGRTVAEWTVPAWLLPIAAVAVLVSVLRPRRRRPAPAPARDRSQRLETALTVAVAGIATAVAGQGMWRVAGDALHLAGPGRMVLFAFIELAVVVSAVRARRALRETGSTGVDGAAVWVLASLSAVLSALDARGGVEAVVRLAAPLVAAWLWERGMAPDRRAHRARKPDVVAWRWTRVRLLVALRLAEPTDRTLADADRARRVTALVRAAWRYHQAETVPRRWLANRRLHRQALRAIGLGGTDAAVRDEVQQALAALYGVAAGTAPAAVVHRAAWPSAPDARSNGEAVELERATEPATAVAARPAPVAGSMRPAAVHQPRPVATVARRRSQTVAADRSRRSQVTATATKPSRQPGPCVDGCDRHGPERNVSYDTRGRCADRLAAAHATA